MSSYLSLPLGLLGRLLPAGTQEVKGLGTRSVASRHAPVNIGGLRVKKSHVRFFHGKASQKNFSREIFSRGAYPHKKGARHRMCSAEFAAQTEGERKEGAHPLAVASGAALLCITRSRYRG